MWSYRRRLDETFEERRAAFEEGLRKAEEAFEREIRRKVRDAVEKQAAPARSALAGAARNRP